ncbi:cyclin-dependent kinase 11B isoform X1 [Parasteatoda tepidariorum]|nr:cyclin-dependent kinase 11B isoform X2 [Parasteatoda tepidariorum]
MAYHDNLRTIPLTENSESEEDGEIEKDSSPKEESIHNQDDQDSESSKDEGAESLDIKPPQATLKSESSRKEDKKKNRHRKHDSRRREHHRGHERSSHRDRTATWVRDSNRKSNREGDSRNVRYRDEPNREKDRDNRKEEIRIVSADVREIRLKKDLRESRGDAKLKDERHVDSFEEKKKEWRQKRLLFMEKKREENKTQLDRSWIRDDNLSSGRDLREKLREKERLHQERERRLERFRSPPKESKDAPSAVTEERKEKELHITPEPFVDEEPMDYEEDKVDEDESDENSDEKEDKDGTESDSGSDTASESEVQQEPLSQKSASSHNSKGEDEEDDDEGADDESSDAASEEDEEEEEEADEQTKSEAKPVEPAVPNPIPVKVEAPTEVKITLPTYLPAIQGCRSVEEFSCLNRIEEGTYGVVYRAKDKRTNEIVALKRLKMEKEKEGFPITSLREINTLLKAQHPNIVVVREIVVGSNMDKIYIVMEYVEHDLKSLMETMKQPFLVGEVKTLMIQLLHAVAHLHDNWILHRDLKTSNLLLSHKGILKVGDFGLAREYGSPLKPYTPVVVTLWYRAPELLLGAKQYSTPIDMWSVGCIFGELLTMKPLFPGKSEIDQLNRVFKDLGTPSEKIWHGYNDLPLVKKVTFTEYPYNNLRSRFGHNFTDLGFDLLNRFLTYNPARRITAEEAKTHAFFEEKPRPISPSMFPTWPAKSEQPHRKQHSPKPPSGGKQYAKQMGEVDDEGLMAAAGFHMAGAHAGQSAKGGGFSLKF